jgi:hypothetical protein
VVEESVTGAGSAGLWILSVSQDAVGGGETSPIASANDEGLGGVQSSCWWENAGEVTEEAETDGAAVEAWSVGTSAVPATTFVDLSVVADAESVSDVSPAVGVHVEVLDVSHLSVASCLGGATSAEGVMNDECVWWLSG